MRIDYIFNDVKYAEEIIREYELVKNVSTTAFILAKYYINHLKYDDKQAYNEINSFLKLCTDKYNTARHYKTVMDKIELANHRELITIDYIPISASEMKKIQSLRSMEAQRLLFTMIAIAKYNNAVYDKNNNWVNIKKRSEIFTLAKLKCNSTEQEVITHSLYKGGYIGARSDPCKFNVQVKIIDNDSEPVMYLKNLYELGFQYLRYLGQNYKECIVCEHLFKANKKNNALYCAEHRKYIKKKVEVRICTDCGEKYLINPRQSDKVLCKKCTNKLRRSRNTKYVAKSRNKLNM